MIIYTIKNSYKRWIQLHFSSSIFTFTMIPILLKKKILVIYPCPSMFHILNNLPPNTPMLQLHCASGDNDFVHEYPEVGSHYSWSFDDKFFGSTLYFCHFWWDFKQTYLMCLIMQIIVSMEGINLFHLILQNVYIYIYIKKKYFISKIKHT